MLLLFVPFSRKRNRKSFSHGLRIRAGQKFLKHRAGFTAFVRRGRAVQGAFTPSQSPVATAYGLRFADFCFGLERSHKNQSAAPTAPPCFGFWPRSSPLPKGRGKKCSTATRVLSGTALALPLGEVALRSNDGEGERAQPPRAGARKPVLPPCFYQISGPHECVGRVKSFFGSFFSKKEQKTP